MLGALGALGTLPFSEGAFIPSGLTCSHMASLAQAWRVQGCSSPYEVFGQGGRKLDDDMMHKHGQDASLPASLSFPPSLPPTPQTGWRLGFPRQHQKAALWG